MIFKKKEKPQENTGFMSQRRQILNRNSNFAVQEAYKALRTNIRFFVRGGYCKKFCITSAAAGEGKSITLLNLAISIAEDGHKVLLIDADLRRPAMARLLVEKAAPGLSNYLAGQSGTEECIRSGVYTNLDVMFAGDIPPNPSELLGSEKMQELIEQMSMEYDYILVDTPPVNVVSDTCVVANLLDGVLLLARQGSSRKDGVSQAVQKLQLTGAKLLGFVLNGVVVEKSKQYDYYG